MKQATPSALTTLTNTGIKIKPAVIELTDAEAFKAAVAEVATYYDGYQVTAETFAADKETRKKINGFVEAIERKRIDSKAEIMAPYNDFKKVYDEAMEPLLKVQEDIKSQIKDYENQVKEIRLSVVANVFKQLAEASGMPEDTLSEHYTDFLKASDFKSKKHELTSASIEKINALFDAEQAHLQEIDQGRQIIEQTAEANKLSSAPYLSLFDNGNPLASVMAIINQDAAKERVQAEARAAREAAEVERLEQLRQQAAEQASEAYKIVDGETGEVIEENAPAPQPEPESKQPARLVLEMTFEDVGQIRDLKAWLEANRVSYEQREAVLL